jgi:hypothetical protein
VEPVPYSYEVFSLPDSIYIFRSDKENSRTTLYNDDPQPKPLKALFESDYYLHENNRYTFDITSFINQELSDAYINSNDGLMIGLNDSKLSSSFERLIVEGKHPPVKLRLYYLSY